MNIAIEFAKWLCTPECAYVPTGRRDEWIDSTKKRIEIYLNSTELVNLFLFKYGNDRVYMQLSVDLWVEKLHIHVC